MSATWDAELTEVARNRAVILGSSSTSQAYQWLTCKNIHFSSLLTIRDISRGGTSETQWQKFHTDDVKSVRNPTLIGQQASYIVLAIVYEWQTKDKRLQRSNVNMMNLQQNSQYLWNIISTKEAFKFCWSFFTGEDNTLPKSTKRSLLKIEQNLHLEPHDMTTESLCKHWLLSWVWNFCHWVADVPPHETSTSVEERGETAVFAG